MGIGLRAKDRKRLSDRGIHIKRGERRKAGWERKERQIRDGR
jgi:hypothetical protein